MLAVLPGLEFGTHDSVVNYFSIKGLVFPDSVRSADPVLLVCGQGIALFLDGRAELSRKDFSPLLFVLAVKNDFV
jgi:hypothetical protein